ncbi:hypothetical protein GCM10010446_39720 [Streptomyces enissocaesilis]|uniref:Uncharacterized protein n=1 Tax=Streptomyces enissocaesilis TaxID=332589 RepID=A0ABN3XDH3_9ACTN
MTVTGSLESPEAPGSTAQPASSDAPTAVAVPAAMDAAAFERNVRGEEGLRRPVMCVHTSAPWVTEE